MRIPISIHNAASCLHDSQQDVSQVEKYMMSDEDYGKRKNTFRAFKAAQVANDPTWKSIFAQRADAAQVP